MVLLAGFFLIVVVWNLYSTSYLRKATNQIIAGDLVKATRELDAASFLKFDKSEIYELKGVIALLNDDKSLADAYFELTESEKACSYRIPSELILEKFVNNGDYESALYYLKRMDDLQQKRLPVKLIKLAVLIGLGIYNGNDSYEDLLQENEIREIALKLKKEAEELKSVSSRGVIFDRNCEVLLSRNINSGEYFPVEGFHAFVSDDCSILNQLEGKDLNNKVMLTIDLKLQNKVSEILDGFDGSITVIKINTGDILAAVSKGSPDGNKALYAHYQPASTVKLLVYDAAMKYISNLDVFTPYFCKGYSKADDMLFYCAKSHGGLKTSEYALAVSCNSFFQELSLLIGSQNINKEFSAFGFNSDLSTDYAIIHSGRASKIEQDSKEDLYLRAIGHRNVSLTPVHGALIAAAIANNGVMVRPRLVLNIKNILGREYFNSSPSFLKRVTSEDRAERLKTSMLLTVEHPNGTGFRGKLDNLKYGIKTGTARNASGGLDCFIIGFAPYENPEYAFAVAAENSGPASVKGVEMTSTLVSKLLEYKL